MDVRRLYMLIILLAISRIGMEAQVFLNDTIGIRTDSSVITGEHLKFPGWIDNVTADSTGTLLLVQYRSLNKKETLINNTGKIVMISLPDKKELWQRPINYMRQQARLTDLGVAFVANGKYHLLDLYTGAEKWNKKKVAPYLLNAEHNRLLAYKVAGMGGQSRFLQGHDPVTGDQVWEREISHKFGWNEDFMLDDSMRLIVSDGLHTLNMKDGTGKSFPMKTGVNDYKSAAAMGALGAVAGLVAGVAIVPYGNDVVVELVSNVLQDDSLFYVANREQLLCMDRQLNMKWGYPIPDGLASHSTLILGEDRLYMVNHGYGYRDNLRNIPTFSAKKQMRAKIGKPFIASFNKETGANIAFHTFSEKKEMMEDLWIDWENGCVVMLFADRMAVASLETDSVMEYKWDTGRNGKLLGFMKRPFYLENKEGGYRACNQTLGSPTYFVMTDKGMAFDVDLAFNVLQSIPFADICSFDLLENDNSIVERRNEVFLLDVNGCKKATLNVSPDWFRVGAKTFTFSNDRKRIIDVSSLVLQTPTGSPGSDKR